MRKYAQILMYLVMYKNSALIPAVQGATSGPESCAESAMYRFMFIASISSITNNRIDAEAFFCKDYICYSVELEVYHAGHTFICKCIMRQ